MKQVQAFGPQDLRVVDVPEPAAGAGEVIVEVRACGICGSDKWFWNVERHSEYVAGHEVAGLVTAVGPGVRSLQPGDRVAVNNVKGCGECPACLEGAFIRCPNTVEHMGFGFSERIAVPERNCLLLDPSLSYEQGALLFDNWGTPYSALARTSMGPGDWAAVTGCGPIGLAAIGLAVQRGARVAAVDPIAERRQYAIAMGAELALDPAAGDHGLDAELRDFTGGHGLDYVVECSGRSSSYELAFRALAMRGTIVAIGEHARVTFDSSDLIHRHYTIVGSLYSGMTDGEEVQKLMVRGEIDPIRIVTHRFGLEDIPQRFGQVFEASGGLMKSVVVNGGGGGAGRI
ncbi:zinc-dependent alcohol dehydrogenase [Paenibacillus humicus]|uniref:zinc-dependent alcohol dehydrogenase n=1 Tax=Paenibacillus humicus TaxID=412861 RepID=UPI003F17CF14